jgi:hypothetical protein
VSPACDSDTPEPGTEAQLRFAIGQFEAAHRLEDGDTLEGRFAELAARTSSPHLRWHGLRRYGAASLWAEGVPLEAICLWGGWRSAAVARTYCLAPPGCQHHETFQLAVPQPDTDAGEIAMAPRRVAISAWWPAWLNAKRRQAPSTAPPATAPPGSGRPAKRARPA